MPPADEALNSPADAAAEIIDLYSRYFDEWVATRGAFAPDELEHLERFIAEVAPGGRILDLGCGSGRPVAAMLIERGFHVTGVDASPGLIAHCRSDFPDQEWIVADMRALELGRRFDGVLAWYSAFHLPADDQAAMARVYARHLKPGGSLAFIGGPERGVTMGQWMGRPLHHASLDPHQYRAALEAAGFTDVRERVMRPDQEQGARVWTARRDLSDWTHD